MIEHEPYLDLTVGPYALALAARAVVLVREDVRIVASVEIRGSAAPMCDLGRIFGVNQRSHAPYMIAVEAGGRTAAVGVDRVGHLRRREAPTLRHIPGFGLLAPTLFAGGLRDGDRLLLVVDPAALVALTYNGLLPI